MDIRRIFYLVQTDDLICKSMERNHQSRLWRQSQKRLKYDVGKIEANATADIRQLGN